MSILRDNDEMTCDELQDAIDSAIRFRLDACGGPVGDKCWEHAQALMKEQLRRATTKEQGRHE